MAYLLKSLRTTQMMMNMRAIPTRTPIIVGSIYWRLGSSTCSAVKNIFHSLNNLSLTILPFHIFSSAVKFYFISFIFKKRNSSFISMRLEQPWWKRKIKRYDEVEQFLNSFFHGSYKSWYNWLGRIYLFTS